MNLGARTAAWSGKSLPYDAEVQYLSGDGSAYIDTLLNVSKNTRAQFKFVYLGKVDNTGGAFGCCSRVSGSSTYETFAFYNIWCCSHIYFGGESLQWNLGAPSSVGATVECDMSMSAISVIYNGTQYYGTGGVSADPTMSKTMKVFAAEGDYNTGLSKSKTRFYYVKIYEGVGLVFDAIPVRVGSLGYMYDKVSNTLFGNAADSGNGFPASLVGPDVSAANGGV